MKKNTWLAGTVFLILLSLLAWRIVMPMSGLDARGSAIGIRIAFLLVLFTYINLAGLGLGRFLLKPFDFPLLTGTEFTLLAYLLGFGCLSAGVMILGLVQWLNSVSIFLLMASVGVIAWIEWSGMKGWNAAKHFPKTRSPYVIFLQIMAGISVLLLLIECLTPVWDYDALLYHVEVPRQFLTRGGFYFDPEVLRSAYPYLGEMLFLVGIAFDLDSLAKLVTLTYAILFVLSSYTFSQRFFGRESAYTTAGILIGAPAFWMWATWAGVDFTWAVYEFWSVYCVSVWIVDDKRNSRKWLTLAGLMSGFALGTKYLSVPAVLVVGMIIAWKSFQDSKQPVTEAFSNLLIFGLAAGVAGGGWYIKNWLWTGNPVYPLIFGGPGWDPLKNQVLNDYVYSFGVGKSLLNFLLLPYNVYAFHNQFSTLWLEVIHPVLWLAFLFPFLWKSRPKFDWIILYAFLVFVSWAINSQVVRYLIPVTAFLSILAGGVIEKFPIFWKNVLRISVIGGFMLVNLFFQILWLWDYDSLGYLSGKKSASEYLQGMNYDFRAIQYIQESLDLDQRVQFLWDGRRYYCDDRCVADDEQSSAVRLAFASPSPEKLASDLEKNGITHLLLSKPDANWFITYHDPHGLHRQALDYFTDRFFPACGKPVYSDQQMELVEIACH